jgi:hypothetical protein
MVVFNDPVPVDNPALQAEVEGTQGFPELRNARLGHSQR